MFGFNIVCVLCPVLAFIRDKLKVQQLKQLLNISRQKLLSVSTDLSKL